MREAHGPWDVPISNQKDSGDWKGASAPCTVRCDLLLWLQITHGHLLNHQVHVVHTWGTLMPNQ